jgi:anti-sigma B factor antagonist
LLHLGKQLRNLLKMANLLSVFGQAEDHGINIA